MGFDFFLQTYFETFLILKTIQQDYIYIYIYIYIYVYAQIFMSCYLVGFEQNLNFYTRYSESPQISNFMKICPVGDELFYAYGQP